MIIERTIIIIIIIELSQLVTQTYWPNCEDWQLIWLLVLLLWQ